MRPGPLALAFGAAFAASPVAWAQLQPLMSSSQPVPLDTLSVGLGRQLTTKGLTTGLKLGDEAIMHAALFADVGYDTNVFYGTSGDSEPSAVLNVSPSVEITNAERDGGIPQGLYYHLRAGTIFRKYLEDSEAVTRQDAINPSVAGVAEFSSGQALGLFVADTFSRYQQAPYAPGEPITRDANVFSAGIRYAPGGGRLRFNLRYANIIDKYEGTYDSRSNMGNEVVLDAGWRFLPKTSMYVQASQGVITYFHDNAGVRSYPLRTLAGLRGLISEKLAVNIAVGYFNAFYERGKNPTGFGNVGIVTEVNYSVGPLARVGVGYRHDFANSPFVGKYFNNDALYFVYQQLIASRVMAYLFARYEHRAFGDLANDANTGLPVSRTDNYFMGGVSFDYIIGKFFILGANYSLNLNRSDQTVIPGAANPTPAGGIDYTKHVLLFRLGVVY